MWAQNLSNTIYIYISCWNAKGPENDQKHGCEGAREELRGSPKRTAEAKTLQKILWGFREVSKSVEKSVVSPFWPAGHFPKTEKIAFFDSLRAPSQLALRFARFFGFSRSGRKAKIARTLRCFVSAGFASGAVFGPPSFLPKKRVSEKVQKNVASRKTVRN